MENPVRHTLNLLHTCPAGYLTSIHCRKWHHNTKHCATCDQTWHFFFLFFQHSTVCSTRRETPGDRTTTVQRKVQEKKRKKKMRSICFIRRLIPVHCFLSSSDSLLNLAYASFRYEKTFKPLALDKLRVACQSLSCMPTENSQLLVCIHATHILAMQSCMCQQTHNEM